MKQYLKWTPLLLLIFFIVTTVILYSQNQAYKSELYHLQIEILFNHNASIVRALEKNDVTLLEETKHRIKGLNFAQSSDVKNLSLVMMLYESAVTEVIEEGLEDNEIIKRYFKEAGDKIIENRKIGLNNSTNIDRFLEEIVNYMNVLREEVIPKLKVN